MVSGCLVMPGRLSFARGAASISTQLVTVQSQAALRGCRQELLRHANGDRIRIHYLP